VSQNTIDETGQTVTKWRLTHDQSFQFKSGTSVNSRVLKDRLARCMYGTALKRFVNAIVTYRRRYPSTPLLMAKFDLKSAYRRAHFSGTSALQSIATSRGLLPGNGPTSDDYAYVSLRMTFGGAPNPSEFSVLSEMIADLANIIIQHSDWEPKRLHSSFISLTGPTPKLEPTEIPFAQSRELLLEWDLNSFGATEAYIDDIFTVFPLHSDEQFHRGRNAALLAIDTLGRPTRDDDPLPRDPIVATKKVTAEGTPTEVLTVLGWEIDTRRLLIKLPEEKAKLWSTEFLDALIQLGDAGYLIPLKRLERSQGRNIYIAMIVPGAMHFQSRMYSAIDRAKAHRQTRLRAEERRDLKLLRKMLDVARAGISLNNIVPRMPDHFGRSDAFEGGLGGYDLTSGRAWRFAIPPEHQHKKSQNFLEYLACMTQLVCMLLENRWNQGDCFLSLGDNTSALGWIHKSNFRPDKDKEKSSHLALARYITEMLASLDVIQCGQWLPGDDNGVADKLLREHDLSDHDLTELIVLSHPTQTPIGFQVSPLPQEITSWATYWVRHEHGTKELPPELFRRETHGGSDGWRFCTTANSTVMSSFGGSRSTNDTCSLGPSPIPHEAVNGRNPRRDMTIWLQSHAAPPLTQFARPSLSPVMTTPEKTPMENWHSFYNAK
jgi:hypothetical protein